MATEATNQKNAKQLFDHFGAERPFTEREAFALLWPNLDYDDPATRDKQWTFGLRSSMRSPGEAATTSDQRPNSTTRLEAAAQQAGRD